MLHLKLNLIISTKRTIINYQKYNNIKHFTTNTLQMKINQRINVNKMLQSNFSNTNESQVDSNSRFSQVLYTNPKLSAMNESKQSLKNTIEYTNRCNRLHQVAYLAYK